MERPIRICPSPIKYIERQEKFIDYQEQKIERMIEILKDVVFESDPKTGTGSGIENRTWDLIKQEIKTK